jgi:protein-L-isoaspartate(D-aspartate) O-methyltransferase
VLAELGCSNVKLVVGDGSLGWPAEAPYDAIIVTAAAPALVNALIEQLAVGAHLVAPVGGAASQSLVKLTRREDGGVDEQVLAPVVFVPLLSGTLD